MGLLAISHQSFWIDEALTGLKARQADLAGWWRMMSAEKGSDLQMPLYMIYVWGWAKIFGTGEWALRAANLPWFAAGAAVFIQAFPRPQKYAIALVTLCSPFAWYYLDEARPYAMQLGASLIVFAALYRMAKGDESGRCVALFCLGVAALAGSSLLGMIWAGAALLCVPLALPQGGWMRCLRSQLVAWAGLGSLLAAAAVYYLWTLQVGARASPVGATDLKALGYIGYELLGFAGLGPGRLEIREGKLAVFAPFAVVLALYGVSVFFLLFPGGSKFRASPSPKRLPTALVLLAPVLLLIGAGWVFHFRVLARHFMPLLPVILWVLSTGLSARWLKAHALSRAVVVAFFALSLVSCLELRFAARHERDDYRGAALLANAALGEGKGVWWNASREGAAYYQLAISDGPQPGKALGLANPQPPFIAGLPMPDLVVTSKPDVYDEAGALDGYLRRNGFTQIAPACRAFHVWQRGK